MKNKRPRPIKLTGGYDIELTVVGYRKKHCSPYIYVAPKQGEQVYGYIEDKDIKHLKAWCEDCLRKRK